jgi:hypothetical protein
VVVVLASERAMRNFRILVSVPLRDQRLDSLPERTTRPCHHRVPNYHGGGAETSGHVRSNDWFGGYLVVGCRKSEGSSTPYLSWSNQ